MILKYKIELTKEQFMEIKGLFSNIMSYGYNFVDKLLTIRFRANTEVNIDEVTNTLKEKFGDAELVEIWELG